MDCDEYTREGIKTMAFHQLNILMEKGRCVDEIKIEWKHRTGLEWPLVRYANGDIYEYRKTYQRR